MQMLIKFLKQKQRELAETVADIHNYDPIDLGGIVITPKHLKNADECLLGEFVEAITILQNHKPNSDTPPQLNKHDCSTLRKELEQMLNSEQKATDEETDSDTQYEMYKYVDAIKMVLLLIDARQPVA